MPGSDKKVEEIGLPNKQILLLQPATINEITSHHSKGLPIVNYVISMFRVEQNNSVRPRRITKPIWHESYNAKFSESQPVFRISDSSQKVEIPVSTAVENTSGPDTKKTFAKNVYANLEQYFSNSSLHGLRYVGDAAISFGERLFWLCSFLAAVCFATYFISSIYSKYDQNPVIMSLSPKPTSLTKLPFPAVTICNMNQAKRSEALYILQSGTDIEKVLLDDYCNSNNSAINTSTVNNEAMKWDNLQKFILRVNPSCQEMLRSCFWKEKRHECDYIFNSALTDEGLCCTFNALPRSRIFRNPREMSDLNLTFPSEVDDWSPENGYSDNATIDTIPWRTTGAGTHLGLKVVLDAAIGSYFCSSTSSVGFKILLHNPIETPKMADFAFLVPPGVESRIVVIPKIFDAAHSLRSIDVSKRLCFFANERRLLFYRTYTERNCKLECQANYTLERCGCVPFYLPKSKQKKICSKKEEECSNKAKEAMETPIKNGMNCNCLPGCYELGFDSTATYGKLTDAFTVKANIINNESVEYFVENMAVLHFYFAESQFTRNTKSELYGFSEFLSNTGGLLGLFLGFSFLSAVEIAYYLSLRIFCTLLRSRNKKKTLPKKKDYFNNNASLVYPFAK